MNNPKRKFKKAIPFKIALKSTILRGVNLHAENYRTLLKEIKEDSDISL